MTSTRAGYLDYLANSTYGLSAIKTAINNVNTAVSSGGATLKKVTLSYTSLGSTPVALNLTDEQFAGLYSVHAKGTIDYNGSFTMNCFNFISTSTANTSIYLHCDTQHNATLRIYIKETSHDKMIVANGTFTGTITYYYFPSA